MSASRMVLALPARPIIAAPQLVALTRLEDQAQAEKRLAILEMIFNYQRDPARFGLLRLKDGVPVTSLSKMVEYTSEQSGVSRGTLFNWLREYKAGGLPALADKRRSDLNTSRFFSTYPKSAWLAAYIFLEEKQSVRMAHECILRDLELLEIPPEDAPSYETVRAFLKSMPPSLVTYARLGRKAYRDRMSPYLQRQFTDIYANEVWVGDVMIFDVEAWNDTFSNVEYGAPLRIRLDANIDYRSRMFVGVSFCWEGSSRSVAATMSRGIRKYGPPVYWYTDNGKPQKKAAKGALPGYLVNSPLAPKGWRKTEIESISASGFLARAGIAIQHCLPFHPQAKCVERVFSTVHGRFDKCWPTYTSGRPETRPDSTTAAMIRHRKLLSQGRLAETDHPRVSTIIAAFLGWMEEYADTPHSGEGNDGETPRQVFEANLNPNQKPTPDSATLALLMAEHEKRLVRECAVSLNKRRYIPVDREGYAALHHLNQCEILIAYEPGAPEEAAALDLDGNFICTLQTEELVRFAPGDAHTKMLVSESMAQRRHLEKRTRETLQTIRLVARGNGALSPLEAMASRLQLPSTTDISDVIVQRPTRPQTTEPTNEQMPGQGADRLAAALLRRNSDSSQS
jgi:putative transposase